MKVSINADLCQGQGRCFAGAPDLFGFDDLGNGYVLDTGMLSVADEASARLAQANCPEHAVFIEE